MLCTCAFPYVLGTSLVNVVPPSPGLKMNKTYSCFIYRLNVLPPACLKFKNDGSEEVLGIFGHTIRSRVGAALKIKASIEVKSHEHGRSSMFTLRELLLQNYEGDFDVETYALQGGEVSFALGKEGQTRKKIAKASGAIVEYVGSTAYLAGTSAERSRAKDYLGWLIQQRHGGSVQLDQHQNRSEDITVVTIPSDVNEVFTGSGGGQISTRTRATHGNVLFLCG